MKITVLLENLCYRQGLKSEHGLSLFLEDDDGYSVLFDAGQSDLYYQNALVLGLSLAHVNAFILSHGHYDHGGGLSHFLKINHTAKVYLQPEALQPKFSKKKYIGISHLSENEIEGRIVIAKVPTQISQYFTLFPHIKIFYKEDTRFNDLDIEINGQRFEDDFSEEQFLAFYKNAHLKIFSSCSHRGMSNILATAIEYYKDVKEITLYAGLHLKGLSDEKISSYATLLKKFPIKEIKTGHCTGVNEYSKLKQYIELKVDYLYCGEQFLY